MKLTDFGLSKLLKGGRILLIIIYFFNFNYHKFFNGIEKVTYTLCGSK